MTTRQQEMERLEKTVQENAKTLEIQQAVLDQNSEAIKMLQIGMTTLVSQMTEINNKLGNDRFGGHQEQRMVRTGRLDFPKFNGSEVEGWIIRCNHFFTVDKTPEYAKVYYAVINLEGSALEWHQGYVDSQNRSIEDITWDEYSRSAINRFSERLSEDPMEELKNLNQTGSLSDYTKEFDSLLNRVKLHDEYAASLYVGGLKPEIRCLVKIFKPKNMRDAISMAKQQTVVYSTLFGTKEKELKRPVNNSISNSGSTYSSGSSMGNKTLGNPTNTLALLPTPPNNKLQKNVKKVPAKVAEEKRAKGECFWCNEKYSPTHNCKFKHLYILEIYDDEEIDGNEYSNEQEDREAEAQISVYAMTGVTSFSTMRVVGTIGTRQIHILIDSGSTHNFVNSKLASRLQCPTKEVPEMKVLVANGKKLDCNQLCQDFQWLMQGTWFRTDVLLLPLDNYDMVLGIQWLQFLNDIVWNFKSLTMQFQVDSKTIVLKGINKNSVSLCSIEKLSNMLQNDDQMVQLQLFSMQEDAKGVFQHQAKVTTDGKNSELDALLVQYEDVFKTPDSLPPNRECNHRIQLIDEAVTINQRAYRYPVGQKDIIEKMVQEMLDMGIIRHSVSSFASPVVLVKKKDGTWRLCVDYRKLNDHTIKNRFPIPLIEELLEELGGAEVYSKLDLRSGYHQIRMNEDDIFKTAFRTHQGLFEFLVLPFGLTNAPATFQGLMNSVFKKLLRKTVLIFFDDILVYSKSMQQHVEDLKEVLQLFREHQLYAKKSKCSFGGSKVEYLGHVISKEGVSTDPSKIEAVKNWPTPTNVKQLRGFLGLTGYYRRFVSSYGTIAKPLTNLLQKDAFKWSNEAQQAFETLELAMIQALVLALPDWSQEFIVETDASSKGLGAVLMQGKHPIAYVSKALSARQCALSVYEKELLAILLAVKHWHQYLILKHFIIRTDQKSLKHLLEQKITTPLQHTWLSKLMGYDYHIVYKKGIENNVADALSRVHSSVLFELAVSSYDPLLLEEIKAHWIQDIQAQQLIHRLTQGELIKHLSWDGILLTRKKKLWIGKDDDLRRKILLLCHSSAIGGHSGIQPTLQRFKSMFYWKRADKDIKQWVKRCDICLKAKYEAISTPGLLSPLPVPQSVFSDVSMDFISGLPKSGSKDTILVVVDRFTKYGHFLPLKHPFTAVQVAQVMMDTVFKLHGCPQTIISDRDPLFLSLFWKEFLKLQGIDQALSTAYHPQSDGQTEVLNRCLETYLRCMAMSEPNTWVKWLSLAEWWYNTTWHSTIRMTPFKALYGIDPPVHLPYIPGHTTVDSLEEWLNKREEMIGTLKHALERARNRMKQFADLKRSDRQFKLGDWVYLKLQPYVQSSLRLHRYSKITQKYFGPFQVIKKIGSAAYTLDLPAGSQLHPTFHVSLLKRAYGPPIQSVSIPETPVQTLQPLAILDRKLAKSGNRAVVKFLVQWKNLPSHDATWVEADVFMARYPDFCTDS
ncbi:putative nucleotidyltransferase, Ribonuclease H [Helianthus annuus]|nr:putative nucleotidyltransferase, Ribonuclease H [Helianthus annuus]